MSFSQFSYKYTADANVPLSEERLVAYCQRIGIDLNVLRSTSVETIRLVMQHHVRSIPFENLAVLQQLSSPAVSIDFDDVFRKLVVQRRGGYCFEQNYLLMVVFQTIGFQKVAPIRFIFFVAKMCLVSIIAKFSKSARVRLRDPFNRAWIPPRTHFFLVITLDDNIGDYIVDCGLGSPSLSAPLPLLLNVEQDTGCDSRRITKTGTSFFHEYRIAGASEWRDVCEFTVFVVFVLVFSDVYLSVISIIGKGNREKRCRKLIELYRIGFVAIMLNRIFVVD